MSPEIIERQLRASLALIKMQQALEAVLPLATDEYLQLNALTLFSAEDTAVKQQADKWLEAVLMIEAALKLTKQPQVVRSASEIRRVK